MNPTKQQLQGATPADEAVQRFANVRVPPPEYTSLCGWEIVTSSFTRMMQSSREDEVQEELGISRLPDQCYEDCYLRLKHQGQAVIDINVIDLLKASRITKEAAEACNLKCMYNSEWKDKDMEIHHIGVHWTYNMQDFTGSCLTSEPKEGGTVDVGMLSDVNQPIRHYMSTIMIEDDLEDCGASQVSLKFRAMPTCFLVLLRQFIRVDRVTVSIVEIRWFHKFGTDEVIMQKLVKGKDIQDMANAAAAASVSDDAPALKTYGNPDELSRTLPVKSEQSFTYKLEKASSLS